MCYSVNCVVMEVSVKAELSAVRSSSMTSNDDLTQRKQCLCTSGDSYDFIPDPSE